MIASKHMAKVVVQYIIDVLEKNALLQSPSRIKELVEIFITTTQV